MNMPITVTYVIGNSILWVMEYHANQTVTSVLDGTNKNVKELFKMQTDKIGPWDLCWFKQLNSDQVL